MPSSNIPQVVFTDSDPAMSTNSTQCIESLNKKIYDSINSCSSLLTLVKEIQQLLDDKANYIKIQEYKNEIPSIGLENVIQRYFISIEEIVSDYLMVPMIIPIKLVNEDICEDHYETTKILLGDILATITKSEIMHMLISSHWYKDDKITSNSTAQQVSISICFNSSNTSKNNAISNTTNFNLKYITKIKGGELYTLILQELNNNCIKYGHAHSMMKKTINLALVTNSYKELIDIVNLIITVRKERPPERVKNAVEIQDKESRRYYLKLIDLNIQKGGNETQLDNSRDNRKTC
ncbi:hypothetical protein C1645_833143 [Glomus cerebriforme]|uniref:Uncharacterized protein n=1 Tax=Glomus cerebriforme TaxID=658196 RepID=A0A397SI55_9GLOM|nr:hypothetical protein C1645_833143 [Glomus cerebriforme]